MKAVRPKQLRVRLVTALQQTPVPVVAAYLFGSRARDESARGSDLDVAVLLSEGGEQAVVGPLSRLTGSLERAVKVPVDLVDLRTAPPDLIHRILRDGDLVFDADPRVRVEFEVRARNEYFDVLPYLERYRRYRAA